MKVDVKALRKDIIGAVNGVLDTDVTLIRAFQKRQVKALAQQSAFVAAGIASGEITKNTRDFFLEELEHMAKSFVKTVVRMGTVLFEKAWNAVVGVIWKAIEGAVGVALPLPMLG